MLRIVQSWSSAKIESSDFQGAIKTLSGKGWVGASLEAERRFAELAGVSPSVQIRSSYFMGQDADVFFRPDGIYFLVNYDMFRRSPRDSDTYYLVSSLVRRLRVRPRDGIVADIISTDDTDADLTPLLDAFTQEVEQAIRSSIDGRKARHLKFSWAPLDASNRLEELKAKLSEEGEA